MVSVNILQLGLVRKQWEKYFSFSHSVDYFNLFNTFGTLFTLHYNSPNPRWTIKKLLWTAYRALYLLSYLSYCYKTYWLCRNWEYSTASANVLGALGLCSGALLRVVLFEVHYPTIRKLQQFLNDRTYSSDDSWSSTQRSTLYRRNNAFLIVLVSAILVESLCFLARLLLTRTEFMLQYNGQIVGGSLVQIIYGMITACWGVIYVLSFIVFYMILAGFRLEMQYYSTFGLIADSFFVVSFEGFSAYSMAYILFALFLILEALLLCRGVEDLNDLQSLRFSYGGHGEISMNSFAELMQKSYSMLTFMLQLRN
uniref:Gustatory receptor n=1 Tax=Anopheles farauti TaxID=69004 RepID=A0A182QWS6_9DIPT